MSTVMDDLTIDDVKVSYMISDVSNVDKGYFFMITNKNILDGVFPEHEHHEYPHIGIVRTRDGNHYYVMVGGRGYFGEALWEDAEHGGKLMKMFDDNVSVVDLAPAYRKVAQAYDWWCDTVLQIKS